MLQPIAGSATLGRYTLLRRIAVGGMGEVFLAREREVAGVDRLVVVKRLLRDPLDEGDPTALFLDEARITARLAHPNLVQLHELGEEGGELFLVMELVPSQNLARVRARLAQDQRRVPLAIAGHILIEAARGLGYAHEVRDAEGHPLHIVHRDVSPSNILVGYRGEVKVADFGIAKARDRQSRTRTGLLRGKCPYMAPEQVQGRDVDARCDVWALGVIAWEVMLGQSLFRGATELETVRLVTDQPIPDPTTIDPAVPPAVAAVIMAALERDVERRLPSAARFAQDLRAALRDHGGVADATELAALMSDAFPDEQRDLAEVRVETPAVDDITVRRASAEVAPGPPAPARRRGPMIVAAAGVVAIAAVVAIAWPSAESAPPAPPVAVVTPQVDAGAAPSPPDAAAPILAIDAAIPDARPSASHHGPPDRQVPIDAASLVVPTPVPPDAAELVADAAVAAAEPAQIRFSVGDAQVFIDGKRYRSGTPRVAPGPHRIEVRLRDGRALEVDLEAAAAAVYKCVVDGDALRCR